MTPEKRYIVHLNADEHCHDVIDATQGTVAASFYWDMPGVPSVEAQRHADSLNYDECRTPAFTAKPSYALTPTVLDGDTLIVIVINGVIRSYAKTYDDAKVIAQALLARKEAA